VVFLSFVFAGIVVSIIVLSSSPRFIKGVGVVGLFFLKREIFLKPLFVVEFYLRFAVERKSAFKNISIIIHSCRKKRYVACTFPNERHWVSFSLFESLSSSSLAFVDDEFGASLRPEARWCFVPFNAFLERGRRRRAKRRLRIGGSSSSSRFDRNSLFFVRRQFFRHPIDAMMSFFYALDASRRRSLADETHERIRHHVLR